jgi:hypothetical protein
MISATGASPNAIPSPPTRGSSTPMAPAGDSDFDSAIAEFGKLAQESPWQRMFDTVLKEHGLTEEQFNKLPSSQQEAIRKEVEDALKQSTKTSSSAVDGSLAALLNSGAGLTGGATEAAKDTHASAEASKLARQLFSDEQ